MDTNIRKHNLPSLTCNLVMRQRVNVVRLIPPGENLKLYYYIVQNVHYVQMFILKIIAISRRH